MQIVAETWLILQPHRQRRGGGPDRPRCQFAPMLLFGAYGGAAGRPLRQAQAADGHPGGDGGARAGAVRALTVTGAVEPWMVFALVFVRGSVNALDNPARQSFVIEMVGPDRVVNAVSLNSVIVHCARMVGPGGRGRADRHRGRGAVLPAERGRRSPAMIVALRRMDARRADHAEPVRRARRARCATALRYVARHAGAGGAAGDDGAGGHAGLQLPGAAAAAGPVHLRRRPRDATPRW